MLKSTTGLPQSQAGAAENSHPNGHPAATDPTSRLISILETKGYAPHPTGPDSWESRCPSHDGSRHNLSIKRGSDGTALIHCHHEPGCSADAIVQALGLTMNDLFPAIGHNSHANGNGKPKKPAKGGPKKVHPTIKTAVERVMYGKKATRGRAWVYHDLGGREHMAIARFDMPNGDKDYLPFHPVEGGWSAGDPDGKLPLYHLPEVIQVDRVYFLEGEKCADLIRALGVAATTTAHGAKAPHKTDFAPLAGKEVILIPDHDEAGESYVQKIAGLLAELDPAPTIKIVRLPLAEEGDDAEQWLAAGGTVDPLQELANQAQEWERPKPSSNGTARKPKAQTKAEPHEPTLQNWDLDDDSDSDEDGKPKKASLRIQTIAATLGALRPQWPKRVGEDLFIQTPDWKPVFLDSAPRLFAWIDEFARVDWTKGSSFITQERFYQHLQMKAPQYEAIETLPHWPPIDGIHYMHAPVPPAGGKLDALIKKFSPATDIDRGLIKVFILTLFWGGPPGKRPGFLITGEDADREQGRGLGKSTLCDVITEELGDGWISVSPKSEIEDIKKRLLSNEDGRKRVARLDNLKSFKFSWADLEGLMTSSVISGHSMYKGEGRRPNHLVWVVTLNGASLSKDMAQRLIPIKLKRPTFKASWEEETREFCRANRGAILGDIRDLLMSPPADITPQLRWAAWERDVLTKVSDYRKIEEEIKTRQKDVDTDEDEKDVVATHFRFMLQIHKRNPDTEATFIPSRVAAEWLCQATNERLSTNRASAHLKGLGLSNLKKSDGEHCRGWIWTGDSAGPLASVLDLEKPDDPEDSGDGGDDSGSRS